jgi:hypothetical protein
MTKWIKKLAASAAIAGALASGAVMASGPASADIYSDRAHAVCEHLDHGATVGHLNRLYHQIGVSHSTFMGALLYGTSDFCPQYRGVADAWVSQGII